MKVIHLVRKPLSEGSIAANVLKHGTGGLNIDASRLGTSESLDGGAYAKNPTPRAGLDMWTRERKGDLQCFKRGGAGDYQQPKGRWPANLFLEHLSDCCPDECAPDCPVVALDTQCGIAGGASRFFLQVGGEK